MRNIGFGHRYRNAQKQDSALLGGVALPHIRRLWIVAVILCSLLLLPLSAYAESTTYEFTSEANASSVMSPSASSVFEDLLLTAYDSVGTYGFPSLSYSDYYDTLLFLGSGTGASGHPHGLTVEMHESADSQTFVAESVEVIALMYVPDSDYPNTNVYPDTLTITGHLKSGGTVSKSYSYNAETLPQRTKFTVNFSELTGFAGAELSKLEFSLENSKAGIQDLKISTEAALSAPSVSTTDASAITTSSATVGGTISSNGAETTVYLHYNTTGNFTNSSGYTTVQLGSALTAETVNQVASTSMTSLMSGTKYYYSLSAQNSEGTTNGAVKNFTTAYNAVVTLQKDGSRWADQTVKLVNQTDASDTLSMGQAGIGSYLTYQCAADGTKTYDVYVNTQDTGANISITARSATVDYYSVTLTADTGIDTVEINDTAVTSGTAYPYLKNTNITVKATAKAGNNFKDWALTDSPYTKMTNSTTYNTGALTAPLQLTAHADISAVVTLKKDLTRWADQTVKLVNQTDATDTITLTQTGSGDTLTYTGRADITKTYDVYVGSEKTQQMISNTFKTTTVNYYTVTLTADTGINTVEVNGSTVTSGTAYPYLRLTNITVKASASAGYGFIDWKLTTSPYTQMSTNATYDTGKIYAPLQLTAHADFDTVITLQKDGSRWADQTVKLVNQTDATDTIPLTQTGSGSSLTYTGRADITKTYDIYVGTANTQQEISNASKAATVDYYSVTLTADTGIDTVEINDTAVTSGTAYPYLKNTNITVKATAKAGNNFTDWALTDSPYTKMTNSTTYNTGSLTAPLQLTAHADFSAVVTLQMDGARWADQTVKLVNQTDATDTITLAQTGSGDTLTYTGRADITKTYDVYVGSENTQQAISNASKSTTVNYYSVVFSAVKAGIAQTAGINASVGSTAIESGAVLLAGTQVNFEATATGGYTYGYAWTLDTQSQSETSKTYQIGSLSKASAVACTVTGYMRSINITTKLDNTAFFPDGMTKVYLKQNNVVQYTADKDTGVTGLYRASDVADGTYALFIGDDTTSQDTGVSITVASGAVTATIDYYTVSFKIADDGQASGSTISSTAGTSGSTVFKNSEVTITATPAGASVYNYLWSGDGTDGQTTQALTITSVTEQIDALCTVTGYDQIAITTQPQDQTVTDLDDATFSIAVEQGIGTLQYQWQMRTDDSGTWEDIPSSNYASITIYGARSAQSGSQYRCIVSDESSSTADATSAAATLTVNANEDFITSKTDDTYVSKSQKGLQATGSGEYSQFQAIFIDGVKVTYGVTITEGSTIASFTPEFLDSLSIGKHELVMQWANGSAATTFTIYPATNDILINSHPQNTKASYGTNATFSVNAWSSNPLSYQWYTRTSSAAPWVLAQSGKSAALTVDAVTLAESGMQVFARVMTSDTVYKDSSVATLTVTATVPQTGDSTNVALLVTILLASCLGIGLILYRIRKRRLN